MLNRLFFWKHRRKIEKYIEENLKKGTSPIITARTYDDVRYALPLDLPDSEDLAGIDRDAEDRPIDEGRDTLYSGRDYGPKTNGETGGSGAGNSDGGRGADRYNSSQVSRIMADYLGTSTVIGDMRGYSNESFVEKLRAHIRNNGADEPMVYKAAGMDRRLFSKLISNTDYKPSKDTVLALAIALRLNLDNCRDLLERAGYALSHSLKRDIIIEYFIKAEIYKLDYINEALYDFGERVIGRGA